MKKPYHIQDNSQESTPNPHQGNPLSLKGDLAWNELFREIDPCAIPDNSIQLISNNWMLITAGTAEKFNTMTASWGALGEIWGKDAAFIFVRDSRYTFQFLKGNEGFSLSFFPDGYKDSLMLCGRKSGRDTDKVKEAGLLPVISPGQYITFRQARLVVECRKMFMQKLDRNHFTPEYADMINPRHYNQTDPADHYLFIGAIEKTWIKR